MNPTLYHCDPVDQLPMVVMEGLSIAYHRLSGATHLLASPAPQLLSALAEGPTDLAGLTDRLRARYGIDADGDVAAVITARLDELAIAGLVWTT